MARSNAAHQIVPGERFGMLTAIAHVSTKRYQQIWQFSCDCGSVVDKNSHKVISGHTKSCGCLVAAKVQERSPDLTGKTYGRLTVVSDAGFSGRGRKWNCVCECGNTTVSTVSNLNGGASTSCGCSRIESNIARTKAFVGERFGMLVVVADAPSDGMRRVLCVCDCGTEKTVVATSLTSGNTVSCGCAHKSCRTNPVRSERVRGKSAAASSLRRSRKVRSGGQFTAGEVVELYKKQRGKCACCGVKLGDKYHRDHIMPLKRGGGNSISNIQLLCQPCNSRKSDKHPDQWANELGRLL